MLSVKGACGLVWIRTLACGAGDPGSNPSGPANTPSWHVAIFLHNAKNIDTLGFHV